MVIVPRGCNVSKSSGTVKAYRPRQCGRIRRVCLARNTVVQSLTLNSKIVRMAERSAGDRQRYWLERRHGGIEFEQRPGLEF